MDVGTMFSSNFDFVDEHFGLAVVDIVFRKERLCLRNAEVEVGLSRCIFFLAGEVLLFLLVEPLIPG